MLIASSWLAVRQKNDVRSRMQILVRGTTLGGLAVCTLSLAGIPADRSGMCNPRGCRRRSSQSSGVGAPARITPSHLMGRVLTTFSTGSMAAAMVGMSGFGWVADAIGPAESLIGLGLVLLLTAFVATHFTRQTTNLQMATA